MMPSPVRSMETGKSRTATTSTSTSTGMAGRIDQRLRAIRKPQPIPRNEPSRTKFEKYDRCTMFEPSQRISASSRNSISALPSTSRAMTLRSTGGSSVPVGWGVPSASRVRSLINSSRLPAPVPT